MCSYLNFSLHDYLMYEILKTGQYIKRPDIYYQTDCKLDSGIASSAPPLTSPDNGGTPPLLWKDATQACSLVFAEAS